MRILLAILAAWLLTFSMAPAHSQALSPAPNQTFACVYPYLSGAPQPERATLPCNRAYSIADIDAAIEPNKQVMCVDWTCVGKLGVTWCGPFSPGQQFGLCRYAVTIDPTDPELDVVAWMACPDITYINGNLCECPKNSLWSEEKKQCICPPNKVMYPKESGYCASYIEVDRTRKSLQCEASPTAGNPISLLTGTKQETVSLGIRLAGIPLALTYDSSVRAPGTLASDSKPPEQQHRAFGPLWSGTFHRQLLVTGNNQGARSFRGNGKVATWSKQNFGFITDLDVREQIGFSSQSYYWITDGLQAESYDATGKINSLSRSDGRTLVFMYSTESTPQELAPAAGYLIRVEDDSGRGINFEYRLPPNGNALYDGRVETIKDEAGGTIRLQYTEDGNLSQVTRQDGTSRQFLYERPDLPWALTGVINERGERSATFGWDAQGLAISTQRAGDAGPFTVSYQQPPRVEVVDTPFYTSTDTGLSRERRWVGPVGVSLKSPDGTVTPIDTVEMLGAPRMSSRSQPAGSGCAASVSRISYDTRGNVAVRDDFNGTRSCLAHDARNLLQNRVDGLSNATACTGLSVEGARLPAGTRKTSYQWHPQWQLPTKRAEPGRITTWIYNGNATASSLPSCAPSGVVLPGNRSPAVLCKATVQATTDLTGEKGFAAAVDTSVPLQTEEWTYDNTGRVLTHKDALGHVTRYAYYDTSASDYRKGDLKSATNAMGHVTRFARYDANGNLLESIDSNGTVTQLAYDVRQRLTSQNVGGLQTDYLYDAVGLLVGVKWPNGRALTYQHDRSGRLTSVADSEGNRLDYQLDGQGRVIAETSKDPQGALAQQMTLVRDALGRVQLQTGRE